MAEVYKRCTSKCAFRTPDGKLVNDLPPSRPSADTPESQRNKPSHRVYDAMPAAGAGACPQNAECRCFIMVQRVVAKGKKKGDIDTEKPYPGNGDAKGALTENVVKDYENEAKHSDGHWKFVFSAVCLQLKLNPETKELEPERI